MHIDDGVAVLIAAVLAIAGIFYTARQQRKMVRKQHTYTVIDKLNDWPEFETKYDLARTISRSRRQLKLNERDKAECDQIDFVLNYYEFLAAAIISGDLDEGLMRRMEFERLTRLYVKFIAYVELNREDMDSVEIWQNLEFICYRWAVEQRDSFSKTLDWYMSRPIIGDFPARRTEIAKALHEYTKRLP